MRRKIWVLVILGAILLGIAALFGIPALLESSQTSSATVAADTSWTLHSTALTAESAKIKWNGGMTTTHTYLVSGGATPSCSSPTGVVMTGGGKGGTFTASLKPGKTYQLYACIGKGSSATWEALAFSVDVSAGITKGDVAAIVLTVFGLPMLLLGLRGRYRHPEDDDE